MQAAAHAAKAKEHEVLADDFNSKVGQCRLTPGFRS